MEFSFCGLGHDPEVGLEGAGGGGGGGSKILAGDFAVAPHRQRILVFLYFIQSYPQLFDAIINKARCMCHQV